MAWIGGYAEWTDEQAQMAYLSVAFSWFADHAAKRALSYRMLGWRVLAGGPGLFILKRKESTSRHEIFDLAEYGTDYPDALARHNPDATIASRGCPGMGTEEKPKPCSFCIVPPMEGTRFTLLPDFPVRPVLCDNNLSALPMHYQNYIIGRYMREGVPLLDCNSGFEPKTFDDEVYWRWKRIYRGPWRFGYDTTKESANVRYVLKMLQDEPPKMKRPYVLIGNEPWEACVDRIMECIAARCEPHVQPEIKLSAMEKRWWVRFDWTEAELRRVQKWVNSFAFRSCSLADFKPTLRRDRYDAEQGLFV